MNNIQQITFRCREKLRPENIPLDLKEKKAWLLWVAKEKKQPVEGKFDKLPHYKDGGLRVGAQGNDKDKAALATFEDALAVFQSNPKYAGIGFALLPEWGLVGLDGDDCFNKNGELEDDMFEITEGTYSEVSPSGNGCRAFFKGRYDTHRSGNREIYSSTQFLTVTGDTLEADVNTLRDIEEVQNQLTRMFPLKRQEVIPAPVVIKNVSPLDQELRSALEYLDHDEYQSWTSLGLALRTAPLPYAELWDIYREFSSRSAKFDEAECRAKWESFKPTRTDYRKIFNDAKALGWQSPLNSVEMLVGSGISQDLVAELFAQKYTGEMLYVHDFGTWLEFDGMRWLRESKRRALEYARQLTRKMNSSGTKDATRASFFSGVETIAKSDPRLACNSSEFDFDNYLLNTPAGVYDLATGEVMPHDPTLMLTKITTVSPTRVHSGVFLKTLLEICNGDKDLTHFHKVSLGAILSGAVEESWLLYWYGTGRNGKNLLADLIFRILGEYSHKMPSSALMAKKYESHPSELTGLFKVKLVLSSEIEEGSYWNEQRLKELTGDENITARYMRQDSFTFQKTHKHLILGNHRPQIKTIDQAIKSRVLLVPFDVSFAGREDRDLPEKLKAESGFVLHWLMEGHSEWLANGKKIPTCDAVTKATQEYFSAQSTIEMWMDENCDLIGDDGRSKKEWPKASDLFFNYQDWKRSRGEMPVTQTRFSEAMRNRCEKVFVSGSVHYVGIFIVNKGKNVFGS